MKAVYEEKIHKQLFLWNQNFEKNICLHKKNICAKIRIINIRL